MLRNVLLRNILLRNILLRNILLRNVLCLNFKSVARCLRFPPPRGIAHCSALQDRFYSQNYKMTE